MEAFGPNVDGSVPSRQGTLPPGATAARSTQPWRRPSPPGLRRAAGRLRRNGPVGLAPGVPHFWGNGAAHAETLGVPGNKTGCFPAFCAADRGAGAPDPGSEPSPARFPAPRVLLLPPPPQQVPPSSVAWHVAEPPSVILEQSQDTTEQRRRGLPCDPGGQGPGGGPPGRGSPPGSWPCPFGSLGSPSGAPAVGAGLPPEPRGPEASTEARPAKATADVCRPSESHRWGPHATG